MKINNKQPEIINLAIFLSKINSNESNIQKLFDMKENNIKVVGILELSKIIESNEFDKNFLLMHKEKLAM